MRKAVLHVAAVVLGIVAFSAAYVALTVRPETDVARVPRATPTSTTTEVVATSTEPVVTDPKVETVNTNTDAATELASAAAAPATTSPSAPNLTLVGSTLLKSTVNILCIASHQSGLRSISGSGVVIDPRGLILTAAHIGQYFLLTDYPRTHNIVCTIRTGGPAADAYLASPVYVSPAWVKENADNLSEAAPKGTGENDFAILAITGSATKNPLPASFTYVALSSDTPVVGEKVAIGGYAAQYLQGKQIVDALYPTIVFDPITDRYTFATKSVDVIAIKGSAAAQEGSSGGGIADEEGGIIGIITTSSVKGDVSEHILNAITPLHIRTSFAADSDSNLDSYLSGSSLATLVANFKAEGHTLASELTAAN